MSICLGSFLGDLELETGIRCVQDVEEVVNPLTVLTPPSPHFFPCFISINLCLVCWVLYLFSPCIWFYIQTAVG